MCVFVCVCVSVCVCVCVCVCVFGWCMVTNFEMKFFGVNYPEVVFTWFESLEIMGI